jgi:D-alanine-D-alanine ligase
VRVLILTHRDLLPPAGARARPAGSRDVPWATEQDVREALERLGHEAFFVGLNRSLATLDRAVLRHAPDVIVNLLEEFRDDTALAPRVIAHLERRGLAVTGCPSEALATAHDKLAAKRRLLKAGIATAAGFAVPRGGLARAEPELEWPRVVKSATAHGSAGLTQASVVSSPRAQAAQVRWVHREVRSAALVERYLQGRELYVSVLAGRALPACELHRARPSAAPWIATERIKWDPAYQRAHGMAYGLAARISPRVRRRLASTAKAAARTLGVEELARVDLRRTKVAGPG